jgi:phosphatidylinositol glycan class B
MKYLQFFPQFRAVILAGLPSALQAISAAIGDFYVFLFGQKLYGVSSTSAFVAVCLVISKMVVPC